MNPTPPLGPALDRLEALLSSPPPETADGQQQTSELALLGDGNRLDYLFRCLLGTLLRRGPGPGDGGCSPAALLRGAIAAAAEGFLPAATSAALRRSLRKAERGLIQAGAWREGEPLWWEPLPDPTALEKLWGELAATMDESAGDERLSRVDGPGWAELTAFLPPAWTQLLHGELEAAWEQGQLRLEPGAVGAEGRITVRRSDLVCYLDGLEESLLAAAPSAAVFVQWALARIAGRFRRALPSRPLFAPQRAMLTRYPAPSGGYDLHWDNPGGDDDNGRELTMVLYLNAPAAECRGGALVVQPVEPAHGDGPREGDGAVLIPARSGTAAVFDSRRVPHQVLPLEKGPARWALTIWLSDTTQGPPRPGPPPEPSLTELLLPLEDPPLPAGRVIFHELGSRGEDPGKRPTAAPTSLSRAERASHELIVRAAPAPGGSTAGLVTTVYRGGSLLEPWCRHHLNLGFAPVVLLFDHLDEAEEADQARHLQQTFGDDGRLMIRAGDELAAAGWRDLPRDSATDQLRDLAGGGDASAAHAARQSLNATAVLRELAEEGPRWLLHLDADELFYLHGAGRGGATLARHLAAAEGAGIRQLRYLNHELFLSSAPEPSLRFKVNPSLAVARLGVQGWRAFVDFLKMGQEAERPYFRAYHNGKAAVRIDAARAAAGVHAWHLAEPAEHRSRVLAGPSILHLNLPTEAAFRDAYLAKAASRPSPGATEGLPFRPSPLEEAAIGLIEGSSGLDEEALAVSLGELYRRKAFFDEGETALLEEAGLLFSPHLPALEGWMPSAAVPPLATSRQEEP